MASTQAGNEVSLKLLVHKKQNKVLFAEAGKDFVDVLLGFLTLPLGTIVRHVGEESNMPPVRVGCLSALYECVGKLDKQCLKSETCKEMLLHPRNPMDFYRRQLKLNVDGTASFKHFTCDRYHNVDVRSTFRNLECCCGEVMKTEVPQNSWNVINGFVLDGVTFIICDDLNVMPNVLDISLALLENLGINDIDGIEELTVNVSKKEVLDLLKCALLSDTPLTDVFLNKKRCFENFTQSGLSKVELGEVPIDGGMKLDVKVFIRKSNGNIVLAQADGDFADFIFSFLTFPLGGVLKMLQRCSSFSCLDNLYKSLSGLSPGTCFMSQGIKDRLINVPYASQFSYINSSIWPIREACSVHELFYCKLVEQSFFDSSNGRFNGFCRRPLMFMVTDGLVVSQFTSFSALSYLSGKDIPFGDVEQKVVSIGVKEGLSILKASLFSTSALTNGLNQFMKSVKDEK